MRRESRHVSHQPRTGRHPDLFQRACVLVSLPTSHDISESMPVGVAQEGAYGAPARQIRGGRRSDGESLLGGSLASPNRRHNPNISFCTFHLWSYTHCYIGMRSRLLPRPPSRGIHLPKIYPCQVTIRSLVPFRRDARAIGQLTTTHSPHSHWHHISHSLVSNSC